MKLIKEIKDAIKYFSKENYSSKAITFYAENACYYRFYEDFIDQILTNPDVSISYITSDINDPILNGNCSQIKSFYINKILSFLFPFLSPKVMIMTMSDLNQSYIRKAKDTETEYIYVFHALMSTHLAYNFGAFDHYDTIFCAGPHHVEEIRATEKLYKLNKKNLIPVGYPLLETLHNDYNSRSDSSEETILIAPSWFNGNIIDSCIYEIIDALLLLNKNVILRPHPETVKRHPQKMEEIKHHYNTNSKFKVDENLQSSENILGAMYLITDWSGVAFEYAWAAEKPILFIDTLKKQHNPNYKDINIPPIEERIRENIGAVIHQDQIKEIGSILNDFYLKAEYSKEHLVREREKSIFNWNRSAVVGADYILHKIKNA